MRKIRCVEDVVKWDLCSGCGACRFMNPEHISRMENKYDSGFRPVVDRSNCDGKCLAVCPGIALNHRVSENHDVSEKSYLVGAHKGIYEGFSSDNEIRFNASSGGILTAISLFCLEKLGMELVLHTGMNREKPWENANVISRSREELIENAGSRYNTSSPCDALRYIKEASGKSVFIGKPCDVAAVQTIRELDPDLDRNIGVVLTFFCAGTPSTDASLGLLREMQSNTEGIISLRYRGEGWPGGFHARYKDKSRDLNVNYEESWSKLNRMRPLRCFLCPDGLGEFADISSGDAWHRYSNVKSDGISIIIPRTSHGRYILLSAAEAGYIDIEESNVGNLLKAQPLIERRKSTFGQLLGMRIVGIPVPKIRGFHLIRAWLESDFKAKIKSLAYWRRVFWPKK
jgi:coenzyme F420 hydrogenase subunit beta